MRFGLGEPHQIWFICPFDIPWNFLSTYLPSSKTRNCRLILYFPSWPLESGIFSKEPGSFWGGVVFRNLDLRTRDAHCSWDITDLRPFYLAEQGNARVHTRVCVCAHACTHAHIHVWFRNWVHTDTSNFWFSFPEFFLASTISYLFFLFPYSDNIDMYFCQDYHRNRPFSVYHMRCKMLIRMLLVVLTLVI